MATQQDAPKIPFGDDEDFDYTLEPTTCIDKDAGEVGDNGPGGETIPVGPCVVEVTRLLEKPKPMSPQVDVGGYSLRYTTMQLVVELVNVENRAQSVRLYLQSPPSKDNPEELRAYHEGIKRNASGDLGKMKGKEAIVFYNFLDGMGFDYRRGEDFPEEARPLKNWWGRKMIIEVEPHFGGKPYNQIRMRSCKRLGADSAAQLRKLREAAGATTNGAGSAVLPEAVAAAVDDVSDGL